MLDDIKFDQPPVKVNDDFGGIGELLVGMVLAPWVVCRFGFGDKYLRFLFRHAHFDGVNTLLRNKNVSAELLHEVVINDDFNLTSNAYYGLVNHPNCSGETVAYLLRDEKLAFLVLREQHALKKGLHFLRDSGDEKDYNLYIQAVGTALGYGFDEAEDILCIDPEDLGALFSAPKSDYTMSWGYHRVLSTFVNKDTPKAYLDEFAAGVGFGLEYREQAYRVIRELDGFNPDGLPDSWMRKTYGLEPEIIIPEATYDFFAVDDEDEW